MNINGFVIYFILLSFIGYLYETIAMTIWSGKFDNRGFLYGPIIPIYGIGAVLGTLIFNYWLTEATGIQIFLVGVFVSMLIEYPTHYILEKVFNQKWWDYTKAPLNINGRVCLPAALGFGIAALIIIKVFNPFLIPIINSINETLQNVLSLLFIGLFAYDLATTISIISDFEDRVANLGEKIDDSLENLLSNVLNEDKPFKDKAYKVLYAPRNAKEKIVNTQVISKTTEKLSSFRKENYKKVIRRYKKYKEYRKNAYAPKQGDKK